MRATTMVIAELGQAVKRPLRPLVHRFFRSGLWLHRIGPGLNVMRLFGVYGFVVLGLNAFYFLCRFPYLRRLRFCTVDDVRARKHSDTIFVFGSGASLNDITPEEWQRIQSHNTIGCNYFVHQRWIRPDYEFFDSLEGCGGFLRPNRIVNRRPKIPIRQFKHQARRYGELVASNDKFADSIFFVPFDFYCKSGVMLLSGPYLPEGLRVCPFKMRYNGTKIDGMRAGPPSDPRERFPGGLSGALAVAVTYGWRNIVLVGVDLYDSRYFFLPPDRTRTGHGNPDAPHPNVAAGRIPWIKNWVKALEQQGRKLYVYNPRSLLAGPVEVFSWQAIDGSD